MLPASIGSMPKSACATSVRPAPTRPKTPRISPRWTRIEIYPEPLQEETRLVVHLAPIDEPAARGLPADEDVLRHREVGEDQGLLVHRRDARVARGARVREAHLLPVEQERPLVRLEDA